MQDRYAGDVGDYGKIALLKTLRKRGLSIGVNWYYTLPPESEKDRDGSFKQNDGKYKISEEMAKLDSELAQTLNAISDPDNPDRSVDALEKADLISGAVYYDDPLTVEGRTEWHLRAMKKLEGLNLVFLDPDNGLLVKSVKQGSARSVKYVFHDEVKAYLDRSQSVLIYNHRCRKQEPKYFEDIFALMREREMNITPDDVLCISFPKGTTRDYIAIPASPDHCKKIEAAFKEMTEGKWKDCCYIPNYK